jgi:hypothetical protein
MKSNKRTKTLTGLIISAMLAVVSQAEVTLSDFSNFNLTGTYGAWGSGTFTSGATAFTVQANANGGGFKVLPAPFNASGNDTISIRMNVNAGNVADKFNIVLVDGDGTERAYRFDGIAVGDNQTFTKNVASFLGDNAPGSTPGLDLANLTAFHLQGTFVNADAMNMTFDNLSFVVAPFVPDTIVNGDFEIPNGSGWNAFAPGGPTITFPDIEGNPSGHAVIDATAAEGFAAIEAFGGAEKSFASLGLAPGDSYTIQLDMKILEGSNIGGVQLIGANAYTAPAPGLERPTIIGDGSTWETYSIPLTVPTAPAQARFTFLWGSNSKVAYDNIKIVLPGPSAPLQATIAQGTSVSWFAGSAVNQYQPQQSADNVVWTNLGPALIGDSVSSVFDSEPSPHYQVLESVPTVTETVFNGSFDEQGDFEDEADGWNFVQSQPAERLTTGGRNGLNDECIRILVLNSSTAPEGCEIQQNTKDADSLNPGAGAVIPGNTYDFSFYAKQVAKSGSYEQRFRISWLNDIGAVMGDGGFQNFPLPVTGNWVQLTQNGLVAPAGATTALIQILGVTGAEAPGDTGEVLIDDVTMLSTGFGSPNELAATATPAVEISWPSTTGQDYQVQSSPNLVDWSNFGGVISGDNTTKAVYDAITPPAKFYKVGELP